MLKILLMYMITDATYYLAILIKIIILVRIITTTFMYDEFGHVYDFCTKDSSRADIVYVHKRSIVKYLVSGCTVLYCRKSKKAW